MSSGTSVPLVKRVPTQRNVSANRAVPRSIGPHAPKSVTSSEGAQQSMYGCGFPFAISANAACTRRRACSKSRVCSAMLLAIYLAVSDPEVRAFSISL